MTQQQQVGTTTTTTTAMPAEMIAKLIPNPSYVDAFNSIERTPRGVEAVTPTSHI